MRAGYNRDGSLGEDPYMNRTIGGMDRLQLKNMEDNRHIRSSDQFNKSQMTAYST